MTATSVERAALAAGLGALGASLPAGAEATLLGYLELLGRWNRTYRLTAVTDPVAMVRVHLLDSLSVAPYLEGPRVLDLGTGPGLPGLVLAVACPERRFVLLDANAKKARFCRHAQAALGVANVCVVRARAEQYRPCAPFATVVARAYGRLAGIVAAAAPLVAPGGRIVAMKGRFPGAELEELGAMRENAEVVRIGVPGLGAERHVVVVRRASPAASREDRRDDPGGRDGGRGSRARAHPGGPPASSVSGTWPKSSQ